MRNKRGFIFVGYIVMLTLLMCGTVIVMYLNQQGGLKSSLVSPLAVLELRDELEIFEMREREIIEQSIDDWDEDLFKEAFVSGMSEDMKDFIFSDLIWDGNVMKGDFNRDSFIKNILYSAEMEEDRIILKRAKIGKAFTLNSNDNIDVSFPVDFNFEFEREYLISKDGKVEVVA